MNIDVDRDTGNVILKNDYGGVIRANIQEVVNGFRGSDRIVPRGCIFNTIAGDYEITVIEVPPGTFPIRWYTSVDYDYDEETGEEIRIDGHLESVKVSMPWQYFLFANSPVHGWFEDLKIFWSKTKIKSIEDDIYQALLPNTGEDGYICMGSASPADYVGVLNNDIIEEFVASFYETAFNDDMGDIDSVLPVNRWTWEQESKENPLCWESYRFGRRTSIKEIVDDYVENANRDIFHQIVQTISESGEHLGVIELVS